MKKSFLSFCLILIFLAGFTTIVSGQNVLGDVYTDRNGGFSISIPNGWRLINSGIKYSEARGPIDNGIDLNINMADEQFSGSVTDYTNTLIQQISPLYRDFNIIQQSDFSTNSGLQGRSVTVEGRMINRNVRQKFYAIQNRNGTYVMIITGTASRDSGDKYDSIFDESVRTFDWSR